LRNISKKSSLEKSSTINKIGSIFKKKRFLELNLEKLSSDHGLRPRLSDYHPSDGEKLGDTIFKWALVK